MLTGELVEPETVKRTSYLAFIIGNGHGPSIPLVARRLHLICGGASTRHQNRHTVKPRPKNRAGC